MTYAVTQAHPDAHRWTIHQTFWQKLAEFLSESEYCLYGTRVCERCGKKTSVLGGLGELWSEPCDPFLLEAWREVEAIAPEAASGAPRASGGTPQ